MGVSIGLVLLIFGWLVASVAVQGLIFWGLCLACPPLREDHPGLHRALGRMAGQWLLLGALSLFAGAMLPHAPLP